MLRSRTILNATSIALLALAWPMTAWGYTPTWVPSGLNPGETYHLVFVTSTARDATSTDIADYNNFVDARGDTLENNPYGGITWKCIGSTSTVNAKDNIGYASSSSPVYNLQGDLITNNSADLWDGTIQNAILMQETGATGSKTPHTGSTTAGVAHGTYYLGATDVMYGRSAVADSGWIANTQDGKSNNRNLYGFSQELTVAAVPEPTTVVLCSICLAGAAVLRRRRRRS